jgi:hypothetical protein
VSVQGINNILTFPNVENLMKKRSLLYNKTLVNQRTLHQHPQKAYVQGEIIPYLKTRRLLTLTLEPEGGKEVVTPANILNLRTLGTNI